MNIYINITIATIFGGASGGLVYYLTKTFFIEKIKQGIKHEYDEKLENIRGEITRNHAILDNVLTSQNQMFQVSQSDRISAVKTLWTNYIIIRNSLNEINSFDEVLLETEFNTLYTDKWTGNDQVDKILKSLKPEKSIALEQAQEYIEAIRPFLNEKIWLNTIYLRAFSGRIIYLYQKGCLEKKIKHWKSDIAILNLIKDSLSDKEFDLISKTNRGSIRIYQNFIEQKILNEISKIITGQLASDNTYNLALQLANLMNSDQKK